MNRNRQHPLLLPSVVEVLVEHFHSEDIGRCSRVCKTWNKLIRKKISPFLNPRILAAVISNLAESSVLHCRVVCSLWNKVIAKSKIWTESYEGIEDMGKNMFFQYGLGVGNEDFERFHTKFGNPSELPLPLAFTDFIAPNNISLSDPVTKEFLTTYGRCVKFLKLYRCKWDLETLRNTLFEHAPNLEKLEIVCGILPGTQIGKGKKMTVPDLEVVLHEDPADFPQLPHLKSIRLDMNILDTKDNPRPYVEQFLSELFNSALNLEELDVNMSAWYARSWLTDFVCTNESIIFKNLRVLRHIIDPDLPKILNLQMKQLPLTTLRIRIRYRDVTLEALHELLASLKHTLSELQIIFLDYKCAHEFPSSQDLYKLRKLELWKFKGQLDFLKDFVALEDLLIGEMSLKGQTLFTQKNVFRFLMPKLKTITFKEEWETKLFS